MISPYIHLQGGIGDREKDLIVQVNALKPDLLFITGDFFSDKRKGELAAAVTALSELIRSFKTTTGIFGVPGNYDQPLSGPAIRKEFKAAGIDILINQNRWLCPITRSCIWQGSMVHTISAPI